MPTNIADTLSSAGEFVTVEGPLQVRSYNGAPLLPSSSYPAGTLIVDTSTSPASLLKCAADGNSWEGVSGGSFDGMRSIKYFGAALDGVTDDGPALQDALDSAAAGEYSCLVIDGTSSNFAGLLIETPVSATFNNGKGVKIVGVGGTSSKIICATGASGDVLTLVMNSLSAQLEMGDLLWLPTADNVPGTTVNCRRALVITNPQEAEQVTFRGSMKFEGVYSNKDLIKITGGHFSAESLSFCGSSPQRDAVSGSAYIALKDMYTAEIGQITMLDEPAWPNVSYDGTSTYGVYFTPRPLTAPRLPAPLGTLYIHDAIMDEGQGLFNIHCGEPKEVNPSAAKFASCVVERLTSNTPASAGGCSIRAVNGANVRIQDCVLTWENDVSKAGIILNAIDKIHVEGVNTKTSSGPSQLLIDDPLYFSSYGTSTVATIADCNFTDVKRSPLSTCVVNIEDAGVRYRSRRADNIIAAYHATISSPDNVDHVIQATTGDVASKVRGHAHNAAPDVGTGTITCPTKAALTNKDGFAIKDGVAVIGIGFQLLKTGSADPGSTGIDISAGTTADDVADIVAATLNAVGSTLRYTFTARDDASGIIDMLDLTGGDGGYCVQTGAGTVHASHNSGGGHAVHNLEMQGQETLVALDGEDDIAVDDPLTLSAVVAGAYAKGTTGPMLAIANEAKTGPAPGDTIKATLIRFSV